MGKGKRMRARRAKSPKKRHAPVPRPPGLGADMNELLDVIERQKDPVDADGKDLADQPLPRTELIGTMFLEEPTDEPGTTVTCMACGATYYVEGIVSTGTNVKQDTDFTSIWPWACPLCGYHMRAAMFVADVGDGRISATHPAFLPHALSVLLKRIEAGEVTADEALDEIRRTPGLSRLVKWIEARGATLSLIAVVLVTLLGYLDGGDQGLTPDQVDQIVRSVVDELDERNPPPGAADTPAQQPEQESRQRESPESKPDRAQSDEAERRPESP